MQLRFRLLALGSFLLAFVSANAVPVRIVSPEFKDAIQPQLAVDGSNIYVAFGGKESGAIFCARSTNGGISFEEARQTGRLDKLALGMRRGPRISAGGGQVCVTAISHGDGNLYVWLSSDAGRSWKEKRAINDVPGVAGEGLHGMAEDERGFVFVSWLDFRNKQKELWGVASRDGGVTWEKNVRIYQSPAGNICECCHPSVAINRQGQVTVMWRNWDGKARDMYFATSPDGKKFGPAQKFGNGNWILKACPMDGGSVAHTGNGEPLSVWRRENAIFFAKAGQPETRIAGKGTQPVILMAGDLDIFWTSDSKLMWKRGVGVNGTKLLADHAAYPSVAALSPGGSPFVVWESSERGEKTILGERLRSE